MELTTLKICCNVFGWQGGTIHQAKEQFNKATPSQIDKICGLISDNISTIIDLDNAFYFTNKALELNSIKIDNIRKEA